MLIPCVKPECLALSAGLQLVRPVGDPEVTGKDGGDYAPKSPLAGEDAAATRKDAGAAGDGAGATGDDAPSPDTGDGSFRALWIKGADKDLHHVCRCYRDGCGCTKYDDDMGSLASLRCDDCREMKGKCLVRNAALDHVLAKMST
ncbi:hypothetical protein RB594_006294 [Gaeumannomyces avenae]